VKAQKTDNRNAEAIAEASTRPAMRLVTPKTDSVGAADAALQVSTQAQHFLSAHAFIYGHFRPRRHLTTARRYQAVRSAAFKAWNQETFAQTAA
jgi:hypothetical protein